MLSTSICGRGISSCWKRPTLAYSVPGKQHDQSGVEEFRIGFVGQDEPGMQLDAGPIGLDPDAGAELLGNQGMADGVLVMDKRAGLGGVDVQELRVQPHVSIVADVVGDLIERSVGAAAHPAGLLLEAVAVDLLGLRRTGDDCHDDGRANRPGRDSPPMCTFHCFPSI